MEFGEFDNRAIRRDMYRKRWVMKKTRNTTILIADSQVGALSQTRANLAQEVPDWKVISADAGNRAVELAEHNPPDVILSDMRLSDMSGLKLLFRIKAANPAVITVMMSDCGSHDARKMCLDAGVDFFLEKPVDAQRLIGMLGGDQTESDAVFRGSLENLSVPDVLQLVCCRPNPMRLKIDSPTGDAVIEINDGQVIHARANGAVGEAGVYEVSQWRVGKFEVTDIDAVKERTISLPLSQLLLNAVSCGQSPPVQAGVPESASLPQVESDEASFFPAEDTANDVSRVWAPMARYTRPDSRSTSSRRSGTREIVPHDIPALRGHRESEADREPVKLRFKKREPDPVMRVRFRSQAEPRRTRQRSFAPAARRVAIASVAALFLLFVGIRYSGVMSTQYGSDVAPVPDNLVREFVPMVPKFVEGQQVRPSVSYQNRLLPSQTPNTGGPGNAADNSLHPDLISGIRPSSAAEAQPVPLNVSISRNEALMSGNSVGISPHIYEKLDLAQSPWVEVIGVGGKHIGAFAVEIESAQAPVLLSQSMHDALSQDGVELTQVRLRPVQWIQKATEKSLSFWGSNNLPGQHCQYWYSVGVSLDALRSIGLTPGSHAVVRGPTGYQSVRVQLVDRGETKNIWLSEPVREKIGAEGEIDLIKLFPKT